MQLRTKTNERNRENESGFILLVCLMLLTVVSGLVAVYMVMSTVEFGTVRGSIDSAGGFNAAEAGSNMRAELIRDRFVGYNTPTGTPPSDTNACVGSNLGTGDMACATYSLGSQNVTTYIKPSASNPVHITIPTGELYQNLDASQYQYDVKSIGKSLSGNTEAVLDLTFKSLLVPLFQFAVFYNKDLEIAPGAAMTLNGPVAANGDIYLNTSASLSIDGQVSTAGSLYRGRKDSNVCEAGATSVKDPAVYRAVPNATGIRQRILQSNLTAWNGMIQTSVPTVTVPAPEDLSPVAGKTYWDKADLRLVLHLTAAGAPDFTSATKTAVEIRKADNTVDAARTTLLNTACTGAGIKTTGGPDATLRPAVYTYALKDFRENSLIKVLDVDLTALFNCIKNQNIMDPVGAANRLLSDTTEGGLVFHFSVSGPNSALPSSKYGVRVRNGAELKSTVAGAPAIVGLTIVSDQAVYIMGDYNNINKKPAAFLADTINILSNNWVNTCGNSNTGEGTSPPTACTLAIGSRSATNTTIYAAFLSGTTTTGSVEGVGGQNGAYNGGLENYPRFNEHWSGQTFTYKGSLVSLNKPLHSNSAWPGTGTVYNPPTRAWSYDTTFNDASRLPPLSPRFVYLKQQLFVRSY